MKIINRILAVVLVISGLMPLLTTILGAMDQAMMAEAFNIKTELGPELQLTFVLLGSALLSAGFTPLLAAAWVWTGKKVGLQLSILVSITLLAASLYIFVVLSKLGINEPSFYAPDAFKGLLILVLTIVALRKRGKVEAA